MIYVHFANKSLWFKAANIRNAINDIRDSQYLGYVTFSKLIDKQFFVNHDATNREIELSKLYHNGLSNNLDPLKAYNLSTINEALL